MKRENFSSGTRWEPVVGYSRAVKVGSFIFIAGTTATDENGKILGEGDPYRQTVQIIRNLENALRKAGSSLQQVVVTRIFARHIRDWEEIGRAHGEYFREIRPATTMVEVSGLVDPSMLVEIEAIAIAE